MALLSPLDSWKGKNLVWGIGFSGEYDEFMPPGEFVGHDEALFLADRPVDGDGTQYTTFAAYKRDVLRKFFKELGVRTPDSPPLLPIEDHEWPKEFARRKVYKRRADLMIFASDTFAVTKPLRDLLERLEGGLHKFSPIRVIQPGKEEHPVQHYLMVVGRWLNSFRPEASDPGSCRVFSNGRGCVDWDGKTKSIGAAMSSYAIGSAHLWSESQLLTPALLISDQLKEEADKVQLRLPPTYRLKSVP